MKKLIQKIREMSRKSLMRNILWLYGVHFVNYLVPFITVPYLTRVLGLGGWGLFALIQSFAMYLMTIVEYNFIYSGTRDIAVARSDFTRRSEILSGVIGAKILLSGIVVIASLIAVYTVSSLSTHPLEFWLGIVWAITLGFNFLWYFQGLEKMQVAAALDVSAKILATVGVFIFVKSSNDVGTIFFIYTFANILSIILSLTLAYREVPFVKLRWKLTREAMQSGSSIFVARMFSTVYYTANVFIVGIFAQSQTAGIFAGADKLSKGFAALTGPITSALFPRLSHLFQSDHEKARKLFHQSSALMFAIGVVLGGLIYWIAPIYAKYYLGPGYEETIGVIRWLAPYSLLVALNNLIVVQWMFPLGLDKVYSYITGLTVVVHIALAWWFITLYGAIGMAWAILLTQGFEVLLNNVVLWVRRVHPWQHTVITAP